MKNQITVTEFYYKFEELYTMFTKGEKVLAIEHKGYDVVDHIVNPEEAILNSITPIEVDDVELYIHNHFINV